MCDFLVITRFGFRSLCDTELDLGQCLFILDDVFSLVAHGGKGSLIVCG